MVATVASAVVITALGIGGNDEGPTSATEGNEQSEPAQVTTTTTARELRAASPSTSINPGPTAGSTSPTAEDDFGLDVHVTDLESVWPAALPVPFPVDDRNRWPTSVDNAALRDWVTELGAAFTHTVMTLVLRGTDSEGVTVTGARARSIASSTAGPEAYVTPYPDEFAETSESEPSALTSAGEVEAVDWLFQVDAADPVPYEHDGSLNWGTKSFAGLAPYFESKVIAVEDGEVVPLRVVAVALSCECRWVIELDVLTDSGMKTVTVDNRGEPFHTVAKVDGPPRYVFTWWETESVFAEYVDGGTMHPLP